MIVVLLDIEALVVMIILPDIPVRALFVVIEENALQITIMTVDIDKSYNFSE